MFIIRRTKVEDIDTLLKLARMVHFINLPPDREIINQKVVHSRNSFIKLVNAKAKLEPEPVPKLPPALAGASPSGKPPSLTGLGAASAKAPTFMFTLEDTESGGVLGTSQVLSKMGGPDNPNVSFKLEKRSFFSSDLQTGTTQMVAKMYLDDSAPTEIGGLILQPSYRGHKKKLGQFLSFVRFHFIGLHRPVFANRVLAEMMAPITSDGANLLWDYLGRRFVPLSYDEADRFCQYSREFITSLLPREEIYLSLLPPVARAVVGEVGPETRSARRMLEKLGFQYRGFVDPFDGGPHLDCPTDDITLVKQTVRLDAAEPDDNAEGGRTGIVSRLLPDGDFFAIHDRFSINESGAVVLSRANLEAIRAEPGMKLGLTPTDGGPQLESAAPAKAAKTTRKKKASTRKAPAKRAAT